MEEYLKDDQSMFEEWLGKEVELMNGGHKKRAAHCVLASENRRLKHNEQLFYIKSGG